MPQINRATLLTGPGSAAIAVVRITGPAVEPFLQRRFSAHISVGRCVHGKLSDGQHIIDDPIVVLSAPHIADINVHGGTWVLQSVLNLISADGFSLGQNNPPEEFSRIWQEVLAHLSSVRTTLAVRALLNQPPAWDALEKRLADGTLSASERHKILNDRSLENLIGLPRVALVGPPNVGKSTLANQLFGQQRSITADLAGTTRDWVGEIADINGLAIMLVDTPGRRHSADEIEQAAIAASTSEIAVADLVILVLDQSVPLDESSRALLAEFPTAINIANKADLPPAWEAASIKAIKTIGVSGGGVEEIRRQILRHFKCDDWNLQQPRCWTTRQRQLLSQ